MSAITTSSFVPKDTTISSPSQTDRNDNHAGFVPLALLIFLGVFLGHAGSYVLYRYCTKRKVRKRKKTPATPNRTVIRFFNGSRLTLNFDKTNNDPEQANEVPKKENAVLQSEVHTEKQPDVVTTAATSSAPNVGTNPEESVSHPTFPQRVARAARVAKVSRDRAAQFSTNPKLAPVQGPLRPLSVWNPSRGRRLTSLFSFHAKNQGSERGLSRDPATPV